MKPKNLDRWERMVEDLEFIRNCGGKETPVCESADVLKLLRKEHAWVVRMVKSNLALWEGCAPRGYETNQYGRDCRAAQCRDILDQLKWRVK